MSDRDSRWPSTASSLYNVPADDESADSDASPSSSASSYAVSARSVGEREFSPARFLSASLAERCDATARLAELPGAFAAGVKASEKVVRDLELFQRHVRRLTRAAKEKCPVEYVEAEDAVKRHTRAP